MIYVLSNCDPISGTAAEILVYFASSVTALGPAEPSSAGILNPQPTDVLCVAHASPCLLTKYSIIT